MTNLRTLFTHLKILLAGMVLYAFVKLFHVGGEHLQSLVTQTLWMYTTVIVLLAGRILRISRKQERDDAFARCLIDRIRGGELYPEPYVLFLRSFESDKATQYDPIWRILLGQPFRMSTFDSILDAALHRKIPIVSVGERTTLEGAGRVVTEDAGWWRTAQLLMDRAELILFVPSEDGVGIRKEFDTLTRTPGLLIKTLFVVLPRSWNAGDVGLDFHRTLFPQIQLDRPEDGFLYNRVGEAFTLGSLRRLDELRAALASLVGSEAIQRALRS